MEFLSYTEMLLRSTSCSKKFLEKFISSGTDLLLTEINLRRQDLS